MQRIPMTEYQDFLRDYYIQLNKNTSARKETVRVGQAFCNKYGITDDVLFYMRDIDSIRNYILENYVVSET